MATDAEKRLWSGGKRFRALLKEGKPVVSPGVIDPLSALLVESLGFECISLGGLIVAARIGTVEQVINLTDAVEAARLITKVTQAALMVDAEAGWGDNIGVERTVREFEAAGVASIHIEDARVPRRMQHTPMVSVEEMVGKIRVAKATQTDPDFFLTARTEAWESPGGGPDEVRRRLNAYAEAGADGLMPMVFDRDLAARLAEEFRGIPLVFASTTRRDPNPEMSVSEIAAMGYQIIVYAAVGMGSAAQALVSIYGRLKTAGRVNVDPKEMTQIWDRINAVIGAPRYRQLETEEREALTQPR